MQLVFTSKPLLFIFLLQYNANVCRVYIVDRTTKNLCKNMQKPKPVTINFLSISMGLSIARGEFVCLPIMVAGKLSVQLQNKQGLFSSLF